jgi:hypothetical protein
MASGAILGICPVCNEHIWEDQWDIYEDTIIHEDCKNKFIANKLKVTNSQFNKLSKEQKIKLEIEDLKRDMESTFKYYLDRINKLEKQLK